MYNYDDYYDFEELANILYNHSADMDASDYTETQAHEIHEIHKGLEWLHDSGFYNEHHNTLFKAIVAALQA